MSRSPRPNSLPSRRRARPGGARGAGFTLVELIVVLVIMAIAAALVIPYAVGGSAFQAQSAARMVMSDLEYAQNQAIVTQVPITVTFSLTGNSYTVSNASQTLVHPITKKDYVTDFDSQAGMQGVTLESADFGGPSAVSFDALGAPDHDGNVTVSAGEHAYRVTVAAVSGRVTVAKVP